LCPGGLRPGAARIREAPRVERMRGASLRRIDTQTPAGIFQRAHREMSDP
jgi:hypothetical protein